MATLLLIGGTGFFGKSFLDSFHRGALDCWDVERVIVLSRNASKLRKICSQLISDRVELLSADIGTVDWLPAADYVIHAAASTDARRYLSAPDTERKNIQAGVINYCKLAPQFHEGSNIVYASSGAVYGVQSESFQPIEESMECLDVELMPEHKRDYAVAKRDAEKAIRRLCQESNIKASIARCFAFIGPWLPRDQHFAIGNFIDDGLAGRPIIVKATYPVYRSYMHADDLVDWLMSMVSKAKNSCQAYNVGSDVAVKIDDLAKLVASEFGVEALVPNQSNGMVDFYVPSVNKARTDLGLTLKYNLQQAIKATIERIRA